MALYFVSLVLQAIVFPFPACIEVVLEHESRPPQFLLTRNHGAENGF
jgi:hypothetical protein